MAGLYMYKCPECNFSVESEGPESRGFFYQCKCFKCLDCGIHDDITVADLIDGTDDEWEPVEPKCYICHSSNVVEWDFKCPTHKVDMLRSEAPHILQD